MYKTKTNKVMASLTELKNKTGDILSLADEFGEVTLTSYNRPKYKVVRIEIEDVVDLSNEEPAKKIKANKKTAVKEKQESAPEQIEVAIPAKVEIAAEVEPEPAKAVEPEEVPNDDLSRLIPWDRNSSAEKAFIKKALMPLITN